MLNVQVIFMLKANQINKKHKNENITCQHVQNIKFSKCQICHSFICLNNVFFLLLVCVCDVFFQIVSYMQQYCHTFKQCFVQRDLFNMSMFHIVMLLIVNTCLCVFNLHFFCNFKCSNFQMFKMLYGSIVFCSNLHFSTCLAFYIYCIYFPPNSRSTAL